MADILCCPKCKNLLEISNNFAKCDICKKEWGYTDGSLSFLEHSGHWEILSEENMRKLIEVAEKENCEIALEKILLLNTAEHIYKYYTDPLHCGYLKLLPEIKNATVLDFGSSLGNITLELAKKYSTVISVDTAKYSLKFLNVWAKQKNIKNIQTILIDPVEYSGLPFQDNSFDIVNFNLVLQWLGVQNEKVNPKESQIKCLKELHRILKPSGIIYLGEINRYHYKFFFGEPDVSMVPYASILPRLFSDIHVRNYKKSIKYKVNSFFVFNFADKSANIS